MWIQLNTEADLPTPSDTALYCFHHVDGRYILRNFTERDSAEWYLATFASYMPIPLDE